MTKLDDLLQKSSEDYKVLTVKVPSSLADTLKAKAKKLGVSRTKLVETVFHHGLEDFNQRFQDDA